MVVSASLLGGPVVAAPLGEQQGAAVRREPLLRPSQLGNGGIDGLQYADATEGLALVQPPEGTSTGDAGLEYPLVIPRGRGITPELGLQYASSGGNGWVGLGWDLSVGEIAVDTTFGAPHFSKDSESETYLLDGEVLTPNANGGPWQPRVNTDRQDYTRQTETEYQQIIRHFVEDGDGNPTNNYYWEVRDKGGNIFWYGGYPDAGGPYGYSQTTRTNVGTGSIAASDIDRSAIVYDDNGNAVKWLLSAQRDVGVNVIRYHYDTVTYARTANGWAQQACTTTGSVVCGRHTFLTRIDYTEAAEVAPDPADPDPDNREGNAPEGDASYQVHLLRESAVRPTAPVRQDPVVDASLGFVDVTVDRLARVEVRHGVPNGGQPRTYNRIAARYDLGYTTGAFGKSLLATVTQVGRPVATGGTPAVCPTLPGESVDACETHTFKYNREVYDTGGNYNGFEQPGPAPWNTGEDLADRSYLDNTVALGALGASTTNSAEGHAYFGFNALIPQKVGSFGFSFQVGGGGTDAISEWIDLNGDNLPDKVFVDGGSVKYRLNQARPKGGTTAFTAFAALGGNLPRLSREINIGFQLAVESHIVVTAAFGIGLDLSFADSYFTDVNGDGLTDFVGGGQVYFNRLVGGVPTFQTGSTGTVVPLPTTGGSPSVGSQQLTDAQNRLAATSPPIDTVRRWIAPFAGTIAIDAPVSFVPATETDGVRVAIQVGGTEVANANIGPSSGTAFPDPVTVTVSAGTAVYFRVGSGADGRNDEVNWSPVVRYTQVPGFSAVADVPADANGLSQTVYRAADDFVLAGRPNSLVVMPAKGTVRVTANVTKSARTSDDLRLVVLHNGTPVVVPDATFARTFTGSRTVTVSFDVDRPVYPTETDPDATPRQDTVEAYLAVDSPIDLTVVDWDAAIAYTAAVDENDQPVQVLDPNGDPRIRIDLLPEIEQYPNRARVGTVAPHRLSAGGTYDLVVPVFRGAGSPAGEAVATVKRTDGTLVAKAAVAFGPSFGGAEDWVIPLDASLSSGTSYFIDVMLRDPAVSDTTGWGGVRLRPTTVDDGSADVDVPEAEPRWRGRQNIFPLAYRGWAVAGYTAAGSKGTAPIDPAAFVVSDADFDDRNAPDGFDDVEGVDPASKLEPSYAFLPVQRPRTAQGGPTPLVGPQWQGPRANHAVTATRTRTSLLGADSVTAGTAGTGADGRAVTRVGITAPSASLAIGIGPLGGSFGVSPSFGLVDYSDMNGDGYPDVLTPGSIHYTDQRGAFLPSSTTVAGTAVTNQDLTFSAQAGLGVDLVDFKGNGRGKTSTTQGQAATKAGSPAKSRGGPTLGGGVSASWTSPNASGGDPGVPGSYSDEIAKVPDASTGGTAPIQITFADVNGDGLPDRIFTTPEGTFAQYNLGYRFTAQSVKIASGGFGSQEAFAGNVSAGFNTPWAEFSGGASFNWEFNQARTTWVDVNGDGILDQVRKRDGQSPLVSFGTGSGVLPGTSYGTVESVSSTLVPAGQQVSFDRASGIGVGFDFTIYIGPICLVVCYLIINPGASFQNSVSSTQVDLQDVNGDGAADSVSTTDDDELVVRLNRAGRTNLLETVKNPLGATFTLSYERDGNTTAHPDSVWTLSKVVVDDGRGGDGVDVQETRYAYDGLAFDRVHRQSLGFSRVVATRVDPGGQTLRVVTSEYENGSVFTDGLLKAVTVSAPNGTVLQRSRTTWGFRDVRAVPAGFDVRAQVSALPLSSLGDVSSIASRGRSVAPLVTRTDDEWFENGAAVQATFQQFTYDGLGNVLVQFDAGEPEDPNDDVRAVFDFSDCDGGGNLSASTMTEGRNGIYPNGCLGTVLNPSPIHSPNLCPTWVSLPVAVRVTNGKSGASETVYRNRDGRTAICDNASITFLSESVSGASPTPPTPDSTVCPGTGLAITRLTYDSWGSYNRVVYPPDASCTSYAVYYVWDPDSHGNIARTTEFDLQWPKADDFLDGTEVSSDVTADPDVRTGLTSSATFDPLSGRVASRTDENGNTIRYTYDSLARIASISSPYTADPSPLVTFEYRPSAPAYGYAVARHYDRFNPGDTIDTSTFVDGIGRTTQTKRDARLFNGTSATPVVTRAVSGTTTYDALGQVAEEYYPKVDGTSSLTTFDPQRSTAAPERTSYDARGRTTAVVEPGNRTTTTTYGTATVNGVTYFSTASTAPNGRTTTYVTDVRGLLQASDDKPAAFATALRTRALYDGMGQLLTTIDTAGNASTNAYDLLGRRTATTTPDGGLVQYGYDPEGKLITKQTPNLRAVGRQLTYRYAFGRLTSIDDPIGDDDVTYTYGSRGDGLNGAGRVVRVEDGARIATNTFDAAGALVRQVAEIKLNGWFNPGTDKSQFRWTTAWTYDGLGRTASMTYPDGEDLTYDYDAGGRVVSITGAEQGLERVQVGIDPLTGAPIFADVPRLWRYDYLLDRQYDVFNEPQFEQYGNAVTTEYTKDPNTRWLTRQQSFSPNRPVANPQYTEIQDLNYAYDSVGNVTEYRNSLPPAVPNQFLGTTVVRYRYDALERVTGASGIFDLPNQRHQRFEYSVTFDARGNVTAKNQYDAIVRGAMPANPTSAGPARDDLVQKTTTYSFNRTFSAGRPHQATRDGEGTWSYDLNGNLSAITVTRTKFVRRFQWDVNDRMTLVDDDGSTTAYKYDDSGQRTIERGPNGGETAFVNPWVTTRNKNEIYKHVFMDDKRFATQRDNGPYEELQRYWLHTDLQGSTNVVTDYRGITFQHQEYFPTGETWIDENSTIFRTPFQYAGGYTDDARRIVNLGARWFDQRREVAYSADPVLYERQSASLYKPGLAWAYSFAGSNAVTNVDPSGREWFTANSRDAVTARYEKERAFIAANFSAAEVSAFAPRVPRFLVQRGVFTDPEKDRIQQLSELLDDKPVLELTYDNGKLQLAKLGLTLGKRARLVDRRPKADQAAATTPIQQAAAATAGPAQQQAPAVAAPQGAQVASGGGPSAGAAARPRSNSAPLTPDRKVPKLRPRSLPEPIRNDE